MTPAANETNLLASTVLFCRALRERGLAVTSSEAIEAVTALELIGLDDRNETFLCLRSVLTSRPEDFPVFAELFEQFWNWLQMGSQPRAPVNQKPLSTDKQVRLTSHTPSAKGLSFFLEHWGDVESRNAEQIKLPAASDSESIAEKDFSMFSADELDEISRITRRIVRRLARAPSRRWKPVRRGPKVSLRHSLRRSLNTAGEIVELSFKRRKPKKTRLVVICDVSRSMDLYSRVFLQFVYGLQHSFARAETFVFSTSLERITSYLKQRTYDQALDRLSNNVCGWSGGTLIGPSLTAFISGWLHLVDQRTIVIILSDGWDTGEPHELSTSLACLKRRARRLIWLNPLLGKPNYQPLVRGMQAALPHLDVFAPLNNLASLRALAQHLIV